MAGLGNAPAPIAMPDPYGDLSKVLPNLPQLNSNASGDILSKLQGQISPQTRNNIQNAAATYSAGNGMAGANSVAGSLPFNLNLESLGLNSENQIQQGLQDYSSFTPTISSTQTVAPALQNEVNTQNAFDAAAPDPSYVANYEMNLFNQYMDRMKPAGGAGVNHLGPSTPGQGAARGTATASAVPGTGGRVTANLDTGNAYARGPAGQTVIGGVPTADNAKPFSFDDWYAATFGGGSPAGGNSPGYGTGDDSGYGGSYGGYGDGGGGYASDD